MSKVVLALSGSLRKPSFTEKMLDLCIEGMGDDLADERLEIHKFHPHKMNIGPCKSCWSCWSKQRPGECVQRDDFEQILDVYKRADYFLWAAPLYVFGFPATVKNVMDRFFIILEPTQEQAPDGATRHPKRFGRHPKSVLISSCGFPEVENFDILRRHFRLVCEHTEWPWSGEILIPASGVAHAPKLFDRKYELIKKAGGELIRDGAVSRETTDEIASPVVSAADYRAMANAHFEGGILGKTKAAAIAMKAMLKGPKSGA